MPIFSKFFSGVATAFDRTAGVFGHFKEGTAARVVAETLTAAPEGRDILIDVLKSRLLSREYAKGGEATKSVAELYSDLLAKNPGLESTDPKVFSDAFGKAVRRTHTPTFKGGPGEFSRLVFLLRNKGPNSLSSLLGEKFITDLDEFLSGASLSDPINAFLKVKFGPLSRVAASGREMSFGLIALCALAWDSAYTVLVTLIESHESVRKVFKGEQLSDEEYKSIVGTVVNHLPGGESEQTVAAIQKFVAGLVAVFRTARDIARKRLNVTELPPDFMDKGLTADERREIQSKFATFGTGVHSILRDSQSRIELDKLVNQVSVTLLGKEETTSEQSVEAELLPATAHSTASSAGAVDAVPVTVESQMSDPVFRVSLGGHLPLEEMLRDPGFVSRAKLIRRLARNLGVSVQQLFEVIKLLNAADDKTSHLYHFVIERGLVK